MLNSPDSVNSISKEPILASTSVNDSLNKEYDSESHKQIAIQLMKESESYQHDSNQKSEQAREYLKAADALEKMAQAVRAKIGRASCRERVYVLV